MDSNHEGSGAADSSQQALRDHRDVGVGPAEGVEQRGSSMDALRQGAGDRAEIVRVRGAPRPPARAASPPQPRQQLLVLAVPEPQQVWEPCRSQSLWLPNAEGRGGNQKRLRLPSSSMGPLCDSSFPLGVGVGVEGVSLKRGGGRRNVFLL